MYDNTIGYAYISMKKYSDDKITQLANELVDLIFVNYVIRKNCSLRFIRSNFYDIKSMHESRTNSLSFRRIKKIAQKCTLNETTADSQTLE